jgi:hypothetical protein
MDEKIDWENNLSDLMNPYFNEDSTTTQEFYNFDSPVSSLQHSTDINSLKLNLNGNIDILKSEMNAKLDALLTLFSNGSAVNQTLQAVREIQSHEPVIQDLEPEVITGPLKLGFALPTAKSIADVMNQWNFGGLNFKPLKDWNSFKPETYRSVKDAYRTRKIIAERVLLSENVESFKLQYPRWLGLRKLSEKITADGRQRY